MKNRVVFWVALALLILGIEMLGRFLHAHGFTVANDGPPPFLTGLVAAIVIFFSGVVAYWVLWLLPGEMDWASRVADRIGSLRPKRPVPLGELVKQVKKESPERARRFIA